MERTRILVTGGAGFIGSNLAAHLAERNDVIALDDESLGTPEHLDERVRYEKRCVLEETIPTDVDVVFHLAALSSYAMHEREPTTGARVNVEGFVNTVEQAREDGCETIVYASTSSVYGGRSKPSSESLDVTARTGYEASILARERYAEYFAAHHGLSLAGLRFFSVYQGYHGGEAHKGGYANVIAQFADDVARGRSPRIYGDGTQTRDFTHVDDVVRALELAADRRLNGVYNVGTGEAHSFNDVVERIADELDADVDPEYVDNPIPDHVYVHDTCADPTKFAEATGWEPRVGLEEGIHRVCEPYLGEGSLE